jgi:hypothetical protein
VIIEVNDAGEVLVPAELVQAEPHTRLQADRDGDSLVLKPVIPKPVRGVGSLSVLEGRLTDTAMRFTREQIYGAEGR